ncbi:hypothetical protein LCL99_02815 [Halomonas denitrificans]|uniref:hypothetical protein n=1 Tax=Halomonas TaxID=2745 RepID=UPI001C99BEE8|nr:MULTISPECIES: hypothetical protein [Halomonas]MBY5984461.1 hypothetical protein [Halomonas sp. DP5Y7-2]MCA0973395.1 hypothetical protein [Halomonas denitrificans]
MDDWKLASIGLKGLDQERYIEAVFTNDSGTHFMFTMCCPEGIDSMRLDQISDAVLDHRRRLFTDIEV